MKEGYRDGNWSLNNENGDLIRVEIHKNKTLIDIREF
jgi:hypothetical protein